MKIIKKHINEIIKSSKIQKSTHASFHSYNKDSINSLITTILWYKNHWHFTDFHTEYIARLNELLSKLSISPALTVEENKEVEMIDKIVDDWIDY